MFKTAIVVMMTYCLVGCSSASYANRHELITQKVSLKSSSTAKHRTIASVRKKKKDSLNLDYSKKHYDFWIGYYAKREKARFSRHIENADKYYDTVTEIFKKHGLPEDLFYVGLIESGYNTHIKSKASAVGPWQFIKGTAKRYGLRVDRYVDERVNLHKSTEAAANYFKDLYNIFGSWELALCAYNKGEYGIINAIRKGNTRDYKELIRKRLIPRETVYYIPKMLAAREMYNNRYRYKLQKKSSSSKIFKNVVEVDQRRSFSISKIAKKYKVSLGTLKKLNPDIRGYRVSASSRRPFSLVLPDSMKSRKYANRYSKNQPIAHNKIHVVRRGESLFSISRKYKISLLQLKNFNHLRRTRLLIGQKLEIPGRTTERKIYVVKRGDNLNHIAKRHNTTVRKIVSLNKLTNVKIFPNQKLYVPI